MPNILFFGDSLTAGYGLTNAAIESFPALLAKKIENEGYQNYRIINAGVSGDTTKGGLARLDYWLNTPVDIFVLELGINDLMRAVAPQTITLNLQSIINNVKQKHPKAKLLLLGMELPVALGGPIAITFNSIFRTIAADNNMAFVPFLLQDVAGKPHLNLWDKLHPSAAGYRIVAENVWPALKPML